MDGAMTTNEQGITKAVAEVAGLTEEMAKSMALSIIMKGQTLRDILEEREKLTPAAPEPIAARLLRETGRTPPVNDLCGTCGQPAMATIHWRGDATHPYVRRAPSPPPLEGARRIVGLFAKDGATAAQTLIGTVSIVVPDNCVLTVQVLSDGVETGGPA